MTGYTAEEVIGKTPRILQGPGTDRTRLDEIRAALLEREPVRVELLNHRKDGTEFWAEIEIVPVTDEHGDYTHYVSVQRDVTERKQQQEALRESEERLRTILVQYASDMITILEPDGTIRFQSPAVAGTLGYLPEEVVGESIFDYLHPEDVELVAGRFAAILADSGSSQPVEIRVRHADGSWRWFEGIGSNLKDSPGVGELVVNSRDITRRKEAEEQLRSAEERYRTLVEQVPAIIYLHEPTPIHQSSTYDYEVSYISPRIEEVLGYSPHEFLQNRALWNEIIHPDDRARVIAEDERTDASGDPFLMEYRMVRRDGRVVWIREEAFLIHGPEGEPLYWQGIMTDVTKQKLAEERLRLLELVAVNANDAVLIAEAWPFEEPGPRIVYANEAFTRMTGYTEEEVIGETPRLLQGEKTDREQLDKIHAALSSWDPVRVELTNYRKDGTEFWVELNIVPVADENERVTHWVSVQRETTERRLVEERLRKSEADLKRAERIARLGNWEWNPTSGDLNWSDEVFRVYGFTPGEFVPTFSKFTEAVHPEDRERLTRAIDDALNRGAPYDLEHRLNSPDGEERIVRCRGEVERDEDGEPTLMFGTAQDVTEQKLAARALEGSERRFRSVVQNSSEIVKITDADGTLRYASPAFGRIFGHDPQEAIGTNVLDYVHPNDLRRIQQETEEALNSPGVNSNMVEYRFRHADGSWRWVESVGTYLLDDPAVEGVVVNVRDVTERKQAEEELEESHDLLRAVMDGTTDAVFVKDLQERYLMINQAGAEALGKSIEDVIGKGDTELFAEEDVQEVVEEDRDILAAGETRTNEDTKTAEGQTRTFLSTKGPYRDGEGNVVGMFGVSRDITDRKRAEQALQKSERRLRTVAAGAPVIMFAIDSEGIFTFESGTALEDLGLEPGANVGRSVFEAYTAFPKVLDNVRRALAGEDVVDTVEIGERAYHATYSPQFNEDGKVYEIIGVATDVTERWKLERDMEHWATHDPLTGLANRRLLFARLAGALDRSERQGESICLLFADLNSFKEVNDLYGHEAGDALLAALAGRVESCLRSSDMAARVGGDEFCVLLEASSNTEEAVRIAERLAASLEAPFSVGTSADTPTVEISASIGIAVKGKDSGNVSPDELMREADAAMYRAKERGGEPYEIIELKNTG